MAQKADNPTQPKVIHTTQTLHFQFQTQPKFHNDLAIDDDEFFTPEFMLTATNGAYSSLTQLLQQPGLSVDAIIQTLTTYPDFESFKMAAFHAYLQQHFETTD
ncbi:MAG: hypothetical protein ACRC17_01470 [Culicoidibacterales bacterium]